MSFFRLQNNVPDVYVDQSRDFQTFCRAFDVLHGGVMYEVSSMQNLSAPLKVKDSLLGLYATKVGFFTKRNIDAEVLRHIVATFPYMMKYKGTEIGIYLAVASVLRAERIPEYFGEFRVDIDNKSYTITVLLPMEITNKGDLEEVLSYVVPAGYICKITNVVFTTPTESVVTPGESVNAIALEADQQGIVRAEGYNPSSRESRLAGAYDTNTIISSYELGAQSQPDQQEQGEQEED